MNFNKDDYIHVPGGTYSVGLTDTMVESILAVDHSGTRPDYLYASCPEQAFKTPGYYIGKKLVTLAGYRLFADESGYVSDAEREGWAWTWVNGWRKVEGLSWRAPFGSGLDKAYCRRSGTVPVLQTSWNDANAYCRWLGGKVKPEVRLPSEWEWEAFSAKAARVGAAQRAGISSLEDYYGALMRLICSEVGTVPVGALWEWTSDWYDGYPGGRGNRDFGTVYRVLRGGSLMSSEAQAMSEYRFRRCPTARSPFYGFRISFSERA